MIYLIQTRGSDPFPYFVLSKRCYVSMKMHDAMEENNEIITKVQNSTSEKINKSIQCYFNITNNINCMFMKLLKEFRLSFGMRGEGSPIL